MGPVSKPCTPRGFFCRKLLLFSGQTFVMQCTWMTFDLTEVVDAHITDMENSSFYDSWYQKEQFNLWPVLTYISQTKCLTKLVLLIVFVPYDLRNTSTSLSILYFYTHGGNHFEKCALTVYSRVGIFADNLIWIALWVSFPKMVVCKKIPWGCNSHAFDIWPMLYNDWVWMK